MLGFKKPLTPAKKREERSKLNESQEEMERCIRGLEFLLQTQANEVAVATRKRDEAQAELDHILKRIEEAPARIADYQRRIEALDQKHRILDHSKQYEKMAAMRREILQLQK